jgi:hypothetical protein
MTLVFFLISAGFAWIVSDVKDISKDTVHLVAENQKRIAEIEDIQSDVCRTTYEGIRFVFRPFFPPPPRSKEEQAQVDKFNNRIDRLKTRCLAQTNTKESDDESK